MKRKKCFLLLFTASGNGEWIEYPSISSAKKVVADAKFNGYYWGHKFHIE